MLDSLNRLRSNALAGAKFHGRGPHGPLGYARLKSHQTKPGAGSESPTGYRSRGPSADRQARRLARKYAPKPKLQALLTFLDRYGLTGTEMRRALKIGS